MFIKMLFLNEHSMSIDIDIWFEKLLQILYCFVSNSDLNWKFFRKFLNPWIIHLLTDTDYIDWIVGTIVVQKRKKKKREFKFKF